MSGFWFQGIFQFLSYAKSSNGMHSNNGLLPAKQFGLKEILKSKHLKQMNWKGLILELSWISSSSNRKRYYTFERIIKNKY
jgi:hypothetical protein